MKKLYSIVTYLLMVPASFLGIMCFLLLMISLLSMNMQALLPLFIMACVVIYTFCTNVFNQKIIVQEKTAKAKLKDWIKVNAFVSAVFAIYNVSVCIHFASNPIALKTATDLAIQQQQNMLTQSGFTAEMISKIFKGIIYGLAVYSFVLAAHIFYTIVLVNKFKDKFE